MSKEVISLNEMLELAMDIGEQMLVCGAEVYRVEDSLTRIFRAMGAERCDVFIITSSMVVTAHTPDGKAFTETRRIKNTGTDYERLHRLNDLSRRICSGDMSKEDITLELARISAIASYPRWLISVCYAVIAGAFTLFFGGGIYEAIVSLLVGLAVSFSVMLCEKITKNKIFSKFISSSLASALAVIALSLGAIATVDKVLIGNIMTLIPGIGITNALRDMFVGDSIAGILRTTEALLSTVAIAAGYFAVIFVTGGVAI